MSSRQKTMLIAVFAVASTTAASMLLQPAVDSVLTSGKLQVLTDKQGRL